MSRRQSVNGSDPSSASRGFGARAHSGELPAATPNLAAAWAAGVPASLSAALAEVLSAVRSRRPLVHQLAGPVSLPDTANAILAFGGAPVMALAPEEVAEVAGQADALVLNLGMLESDRLQAMRLAGQAASRVGVPIVLDPVGVGTTAFRAAAAEALLSQLLVSVVRGNAGEIVHLARLGSPVRPEGWRTVRGVDTAAQLAAAEASAAAAAEGVLPPAAESASWLARRYGLCVAATGPRDVVATASQLAIVENGTALLTQISGSGCIASALVGCCLGAGAEPFLAALTALVALGLAGEQAANEAAGPGTFRAALLDALAALTPQALAAGARVRLASLTRSG